MRKYASLCVCLCACGLLSVSAFAGVTISSPGNGSAVGSSVNVVASATSSSCSSGVGSMGIYPASSWLVYTSNGSKLNTSISLNPGTYNLVVVAWDNCGGASTAGVTITVKEGTGVYVAEPTNNSTVGTTVSFVASSTSSCAAGVASMGIYTAPSQLAYVTNGASLNTTLNLSPGTYNTTVQEWDKCGGSSTAPVTVTVGGGNSFSEVQSAGGWNGYAQQPPTYQDCNTCTPSGPGTTWAMYQGIKSPSLSGNATQFNIGGDMAYSDVLWNNHLIGDLSSQGMPDSNHTLVPTLSSFTYDVYFYGAQINNAQAVEFDINQFFNNMGFTWGHECRVMGGNEWDTWDNGTSQWVPTGIPCYPLNNQWNHLTLQVQRTANNQLLYQSITFNGTTYNLNKYSNNFSAPGWYGVTVNYQSDGNYAQWSYDIVLDNLTFTYH
jgi:hypothetical protein